MIRRLRDKMNVLNDGNTSFILQIPPLQALEASRRVHSENDILKCTLDKYAKEDPTRLNLLELTIMMQDMKGSFVSRSETEFVYILCKTILTAVKIKPKSTEVSKDHNQEKIDTRDYKKKQSSWLKDPLDDSEIIFAQRFWALYLSQLEDLLALFKKADVDNQGYLNDAQLYAFLCLLHVCDNVQGGSSSKISKIELREAFSHADLLKRGKISPLEAFWAIYWWHYIKDKSFL